MNLEKDSYISKDLLGQVLGGIGPIQYFGNHITLKIHKSQEIYELKWIYESYRITNIKSNIILIKYTIS